MIMRNAKDLVEQGRFGLLEEWLSGLPTEILEGSPWLLSGEIEARFIEAMFAALLYRKPEHPDMEIWTKRAFSITENTSNINLKIQTVGLLAFYYVYIGRFEMARLALDDFNRLIRSREAPVGKIIFLALKSTFHVQAGWPEKCIEDVAEALELSRKTGIQMFKVSTLVNGILAAYNLNDPVQVDQWILEMESSLNHSRSWDLSCYHTAKALQCQLRKDPVSALSHAVRGSDLIRKNGISIIAYFLPN